MCKEAVLEKYLEGKSKTMHRNKLWGKYFKNRLEKQLSWMVEITLLGPWDLGVDWLTCGDAFWSYFLRVLQDFDKLILQTLATA